MDELRSEAEQWFERLKAETADHESVASLERSQELMILSYSAGILKGLEQRLRNEARIAELVRDMKHNLNKLTASP